MKNALRSLWVVATLGACQSSEEPAPTSETPKPLAAGPAASIGLVPTARLAFVPDGSAYRGGYLTHDVRVADGIIDMVPKSIDPMTGTRMTGGSMSLETSGVTLGDALLGMGVDQPVAVAPNVVQINRGDFVEQITNREDGVEQSWVFQAKPEGLGDLTVDVSVSNQTFAAENERGVHFSSPLGMGFVYSHAVWRDSLDQAWPIPVRYEGGRLRITIPEDVLATSTYPATLDPTISAELFVDNPAIGTTGFSSFQQDVASDGTQYFVVWADQRDDRNFDIFGARVTSAGALTDTTGIRIATGTATVANPVVASVGNGFVVAWEQLAGTGNNDVGAAFVDGATGAVTQLGMVAATSANESQLAIAGQSGNALLTWQSGTTSVMGAVYNGTAFGAPFAVVTGASTEAEPAVGSNGAGTYLVTYTETGSSTNIRGQLVTSAGALSGAAFDVSATTAAEVQSTVGFDGTNFVVAFQASTDIKGVRVAPAGTVLDATAVVINSNTNAQTLPDIACAAGACLVAWDDLRNQATTGHDIFAAVIGTSGAITVTTNDIALSVLARSQSAPHVALAGTTYLSVWDDNRNTDTIDVRGTRVSSAGAILDPTNLVIVRNTSNFGAPTSGPTIAQTSVTDVFFNDSQIPDENIVHVRFTSTGAQADNPPKIVSNATADQIQPSGAAVGGNSLVVWTDSRNFTVRNIFAARVNVSTGAVIDANGIQVSSGAGDQVVPKVASAGTSALVVWQDRRNANFDIFGAIIDSTGAVTMTDIPICVAASDQTRPAVAYDSVNNQYLVVWQDPTGGTLDIRGARVSAAGAVLDGSCGAVISGAAGSQFSADAACSAGQCLVVWEDRRSDPALGDIFGSRVTLGAALTVLDPNGIAIDTTAGSAQAAPTLAASNGYLVAWSDTRNSATTGTDIFGGQVGTNGIVSATFPISQDPEDETLPDLVPAASGSNPFTITYLKKNNALDAQRIQVRRIGLSSGTGQSCTADNQCTSGFCRDYKCCNTDCGGGGANGNTGDCQACSLAHHGTADGTCTTIPASPAYVCRLYIDPFCDRSEVCDGVSTTCPPDLGQHQGLVCNSTTGTVCPANDVSGSPHRCP